MPLLLRKLWILPVTSVDMKVFSKQKLVLRNEQFFNQLLNIHSPPKNLFVTHLIARYPNAYWLVTNLRHLQYSHND